VEAPGPILLVLSIPLILRWVPPNRFYGFRVPATCSNRDVWYAANAPVGRHIFLLGLMMVAFEFVLPLTIRNAVLTGIATIGLAVIIIADWRTANRWSRDDAERQQRPRA
jgi:hypothetical protein